MLGPKEPPMEYYQNLISVISNTFTEEPTAKILDFNDNGNSNGPKAINCVDTTAFIKKR